MSDFGFAVREVLESEGVFSDRNQDPGGATRYGITEEVARRHGYTGEMRDLPKSLAIRIYEVDYWQRLSLDDVRSPVIATQIFQCGVNQGQGWGAYCAQLGTRLAGADEAHEMDLPPDAWRRVSVFEALPISRAVDGQLGPITLGAIDGLATRYEEALLAAIALWQGVRYLGVGIELCRQLLGLAESSQSRDAFMRGWLVRASRLLARCPHADPVDPDPLSAGATE